MLFSPPKISGPPGLACWQTQTVTTDFSSAGQTSNCISRNINEFVSPTLSLGPVCLYGMYLPWLLSVMGRGKIGQLARIRMGLEVWLALGSNSKMTNNRLKPTLQAIIFLPFLTFPFFISPLLSNFNWVPPMWQWEICS